MIVDNLRVVCVAVGEAETEPPLRVDSDAVEAFAVALERLESISGRRPEETQCRGDIKLRELALQGYFTLAAKR